MAARSEEIGRTLLGKVLLGQPVVLFRTLAGEAVALIDACSHRKFPLSRSCLVEDRIRCGYHGFEFDAVGRCVGIPASDTIPKEANVRSYPVIERDGFVWIWMGDSARADPSAIVDYSHMQDGGQARRTDEIECHYQALVENLLDFSHLPFVHATNQGHAGNAQVVPKVRPTEYGLRAERRIENSPVPPVFCKAMGVIPGSLIHHTQVFEFHAPGVVFIKQSVELADGSAPALQFSSNHFVTPSTERKTHYFSTLVQGQDGLTDVMLAGMAEAAAVATKQDKDVLELQDRNYWLLAGTECDAPAIASKFDRAPLLSRSILRQRLGT